MFDKYQLVALSVHNCFSSEVSTNIQLISAFDEKTFHYPYPTFINYTQIYSIWWLASDIFDFQWKKNPKMKMSDCFVPKNTENFIFHDLDGHKLKKLKILWYFPTARENKLKLNSVSILNWETLMQLCSLVGETRSNLRPHIFEVKIPLWILYI